MQIASIYGRLGAVWLAVIVVAASVAAPPPGIYLPRETIQGSVFVEVQTGTAISRFALPDVNLNLTNLADATIRSATLSDDRGQFSFPLQPAGSYDLCWTAAGFLSGCYTSAPIVISNIPLVLDPIILTVLTNSSEGMVYGKVTFTDGSPVVQQDGFFGIDVRPVVRLEVSGGTPLASAPLNRSSQYVMSGVPRLNDVRLTTSVEGISVSTTIDTHVVGEANLVVPNRPPVIQFVNAELGGQPVFRVPAGTTVAVTAYATDPDGDSLTFQWYTPYGPASLPAISNVSWTLPNVADGLHYLMVRVSDGKGGYDTARLTLTTNPKVNFSGWVTGTDLVIQSNGQGGFVTNNARLNNAVVTLNGQVVGTDDDAYFNFLTSEAIQYDLLIQCEGYAPLSKVLYGETVEQEYCLVRISSTGNNCTNHSNAEIIVTNEQGAVLVIPPGSLEDAFGNLYDGDVRASLNSLDPCDAATGFPGGNLREDGTALDPYSLLGIELADCDGLPLYVRSSASVVLFVPVSEDCLDPGNPVAPADFLSLSSNRWREAPSPSGSVLTNIPPSDFNGKTGHAVDISGALRRLGGVAQRLILVARPYLPTYLWITADRSLHVPFTVMIYRDNGGNQRGTFLRKVDVMYQTTPGGNEPGPPTGFDAFWRDGRDGRLVALLPAGPLWIDVLSLRQAPGLYFDLWAPNKQPVPDSAKQVIQTIKLDTTTEHVVIAGLGEAPPNGGRRSAELKALTPAVATTLWDQFLNAREGTAADGARYYSKIDPRGLKTTFRNWQLNNGWTVGGINNFLGPNAGQHDSAFAIYFNSNDLGAGRRMGMKRWQERDRRESVAYYVATYASLDNAIAGQKLKYIVCMEYSLTYNDSARQKPNGERYIKFYAYDANGNRTAVVPDEDRHRPLHVPYVCMVCHGGGKSDTAVAGRGDVGGQFVGFDTANYTFSAADAYSRRRLNDTFRALNDGLRVSSRVMPSHGNLLQLIDAFRANNSYTAAPPAPGTWGGAGDLSLYNDVYAVSCRSCHVTQRANRWGVATTFRRQTHGTYDIGGDPTASGAGYMPNAQRTYSIFWGSACAKHLLNNPANVVSQPEALSGLVNRDYFK
ncbi:MAG TPA: hypothetical protein PLX89_01345 [Verrucomicrobiota bacterium]|nr:hypothetical protein [Verrucomicrobiales bacterium]HRI11622.1 hypothetical protein [Verrucomicrobiota bacterium]